MFCPNCSEPKANETTQFCKRCGLDLFGLSEFVESGASDVRTPDAKGKQAKGIRQGVKLLALGLMLIPVWMFIGIIFPPNDRLVESAPSTTALEAIAWIAMWVAFIAGALRIAYAALFEEKRSISSHRSGVGPANKSAHGLPSGDAFRPTAPGGWKTTGELFEPVKRTARTSGDL
jgi:hypothetical protein